MPPIAQVSNTFDWWATTGGVLGVLVFLGLAAIGWGVREWWKVTKPHLLSKQTLELEREKKQGELYDTLKDSEGEKMALQQHVVKLLESTIVSQQAHALDCRDTHKLVTKIAERLEAG